MPKKDVGRYSSKNKMGIVMEYIRGVSLDELARQHKVPAHKISQWHEQFISAGQSGLKAKGVDPRDEEIRKLKEKLGDLLFHNDALEVVNKALKGKLKDPF